jgi:hypothetical protein
MLWPVMTATRSEDGDVDGDDAPAVSARVPPVEQRSSAGVAALVARVDQAAQVVRVTMTSCPHADPS